MTTEQDWKRLGEAFAEARKAAGLTQMEVAQRLSVTRTPIQAAERGVQPNGNPFTKVTGTMRAYARLVGWTEDSPARILRGEEPEPATHPALPADAELASGLPMAVERELRSGRTLDHAVVNLGTQDADDTRIIVVLQGGEDMTEDEIDAAWAKWRKTRRHLQAIPGETDTPQET
jgi:transcriptional regulator with XRE-family HTH domain